MNSLPNLSQNIIVNSSEKRKVEIKWGVLFIYRKDNNTVAYSCPLRPGMVINDCFRSQIIILDSDKAMCELSFDNPIEQETWLDALTQSRWWNIGRFYSMEEESLTEKGAFGSIHRGVHMESGESVA